MALAAVEVDTTIERYVEALSKRIRVELVYVSGSYADREPDEWSDVDLAIVSPDFGRDWYEDARLLSGLSWDVAPDVQALTFLPDQWDNADSASFIGELKQTGRLVYDGRSNKEAADGS